MVIQPLLAAAVLWTAMQQPPPRDPVPASTAPPTAAIHGRVVDDAGRPVGGALVSVVGVAPGGARTTRTGEDGRFAVEALPAGRVVVTAMQTGYAPGEYGRPSPHTPSTAVVLQPGQRFQADIVLPRGAVVAGVVMYENGEPVPDMRVAAHPVRHGSGPTLWQVSGGWTDRNGAFRLWGLPPGEYSIRTFNSFDDMSAVRQGSALVAVGPGDERTVHLELVRGLPDAAVVEGTAFGPDGRPFDRLEVKLVDAITQGVLRDPVAKGDGTFRFRAVPAGRYRLVARGTVQGAPAPGSRVRTSSVFVGIADVHVDGQATVTVPVTMGSGVSLTGRIMASPSSASRLDFKMVYVGVSRPDLPDSLIAHQLAVRYEPDGRFEVQGLPPGRYTMRVSLAPALAGWRPVSAIAGGVDMLDVAIEITEDARGVVLTLTDRPTPLTVSLRDTAGAPVHDVSVVVYSADRRHWFTGSRWLALVRPDTDGELRIEHLPPGNYRMALVPDVPASWQETAFLETLRASGTVALSEGEPATREIVVVR
jgi:protocatechuate 3,4-dioxygenase beta subunit